ncbi:hypothetical protein L596_007242 [Steinernema carpocapsae]|uniref:ARID domain-containing protein n=2 Tax=Steinernema carpocapsae TaxID=34508 RepID=A0A4U5P8M8_STECR|nr:hypothetical protein L596_007242 [Steinernema carpocapsae]
MNVLPPFLTAALQQNPLLQQQMLGLTTTGIPSTPFNALPVFGTTNDEDEDSENIATTEPEDLTVGTDYRFRKEKKTDSSEDGDQNPQQNWSFEEQFKQLYELSDDQKRKEWLDDWLSFMHKIGKPVTRIPIMAKQVLDLYELYRLVVQHGGLVEIINKKLWREITKGLNLPSSITSAAFTLRTQYQKYLYDYECEKEALSNPADLQQAIDGNRREGRRAGGSSSASSAAFPYSLTPHSTHALLAAKHHLNGAFSLGPGDDDSNGLGSVSTTQQALVAAYKAEQLANMEAQQRHFELIQRATAEAASRQQSSNVLPNSGRESTSSYDSDPPVKRARTESRILNEDTNANTATPSLDRIFNGVPTTHLKISKHSKLG